MPQLRYTTPRGITVTRTNSTIAYANGLSALLHQLDKKRGIYLSSGYEYPERYSRWDVASVAPPLESRAHDRTVDFRALNQRGVVLLSLLRPLF
jgi:anthranilate synthase